MKKSLKTLLTHCLYLGLFFFASTTIAQTTAIPDAAFEQKLITLGIDSDGTVNGLILNSDAAAVTYLDARTGGIKITDLTGIQAFVNLDTLDCSSNLLTTLDLSNNIALTRLSCSGNQLTNLNISNNTALTVLNCEVNNLTNLDLSNNTNLVHISCSVNLLTELNLYSPNLEVLYCFENHLTSLNVSNQTSLTYLNCQSNLLTTLNIKNCIALEQLHCGFSPQLSLVNLKTCPNLRNVFCDLSLQLCVLDIQTAIWSIGVGYNFVEDCYDQFVSGRVVFDANSNCIADPLENGMSGKIIHFYNNGDGTTTYTVSDPIGNYEISLDTGTYTVSLTDPNYYTQACPSSQQIIVNQTPTHQTINWTLQAVIPCPLLEVDIAAPFLRNGGGGSNYSVSYCNVGTVDALNAYVEVTIDPDLNVLSTGIPITNQNGNIYTFNLGMVGVGEWNYFTIQVQVDSGVTFQQTHCSEAHIYPDSICLPTWTGSIADLSVSCQNDTVFFSIENKGASMPALQPYYVFEDNIMMRSGSVQLGAGQTSVIAQAAAQGKSYRLEVEQMTGFPTWLGDSIASVGIEGCNPFSNGSFNTGFITQFYNDNSSHFIAVDCQQNIGSYDPNDKAAQPEGYDNTYHYIYKNTPLDYRIRFQNTGTDTAFNIKVVDIIAAHLDITSIQMGASSHTYSWTIEEDNMLVVSFDNIMLADSNINEPLSHGFFNFKIQQKANNPVGTVINNMASIYFDYNAPIQTNTTWHTIGENFVTVNLITSIEEIFDKAIQVSVYPNPFSQTATIEIQGKDYNELNLSIFDITGRQVAQEQAFGSNKIQVNKGSMQTGIYFYKLEGDGKLINSGKMVISE